MDQIGHLNASTASVPAGYHERFLQVDVSTGTGTLEPIPAQILRQFLGGSGLGTWLLLRSGQAPRPPLAPASPLIFALSPLVGSPLTTSAKFAVVSKSPLTGRINDSLMSSGFALAAKKCGFDALVLIGRAPQPSILIIDEGEARLEPAGELWGLPCSETEQAVRARYGQSFQAAVIGPAGEQQVHFATISHAGRHAGRGGSGAVLGSKNVKAILVRGSRRCDWFHADDLVRLARRLSDQSLGPVTAKYRELGTAANLLVFNRLNTLPTHNFQQGSFAGANQLAPESLTLSRSKLRGSCVACTIGCEHIYQIRPVADGPSAGVRIEYENLFSLGSLCGIADPEVVLTASRMCDELGLDTISTGGTVAFAMECVERGLLDQPWLQFGSGTALLRTIDLIARREGLGDSLANGSRSFAQAMGNAALSFAPQVKGLEIPGYEPRTMQTLALGLAVGTRGADHNRSGAAEIDFSDRVDRRHLTDSSVSWAVQTEDQAALLDSLILCRFLRNALTNFYEDIAEMLRVVTGWDLSGEELRVTARRIITAKKLFNIRAGWTPAEDTLPARFLEQPLSDDHSASLSRTQLQRAIHTYNRQRGWSTEGWIDQHQLAELDLCD